MQDKLDLSVVIPAFNEEDNVALLYTSLKKILDASAKSYEIIFVDDGSTDSTFKELEKICNKDSNVRVIQFRDNFAKAAALSAGFSKAKGKLILTMDADLQDDPEEIPKFLEKINEGYDLVVGWKHKRKDPITKIIASRVFNFLVRILTRIKLHDSDCNFRIMKREIVENMNIYGGLYRFIPSLARSLGYKIGEVKVKHHARKYGKSKYGAGRLFGGFFDLLTIKFLISFRRRPLHLFGGIGAMLFSVGFLIGLYLLYLKYVLGQLIGDRLLLMLAVLLLILGIQSISTGLLGEMVTSTSLKSEKQYTVKKEL